MKRRLQVAHVTRLNTNESVQQILVKACETASIMRPLPASATPSATLCHPALPSAALCHDLACHCVPRYLSWLINEQQQTVYAMKLATGFQLIGDVGLSDYTRWLAIFQQRHLSERRPPIRHRVNAR